MALTNPIKDNDWRSVRQAIQQLSHLRLGPDSSPVFTGVVLTGLTANSLIYATSGGTVSSLGVATNGQLPIGSTGAAPVLATLTGTTNRVTVTNGTGSITLSLPQDIHTGAIPTFAGMILNGTTATGLDMSGGTFATAVQNWPANPVIQISGSNYFRSDETNFNGFLGFNSFSGLPGGISQTQNDGEQNVGIGYESGYNNDRGGGDTGRRNIYIGYQAGKGDAGGNTGFENVGIGALVLQSLTSGSANVAIGYAAGGALTTGLSNFMLGAGAGATLTTADNNVLIGSSAGRLMTSGENLAIGKAALENCTGGQNVALGNNAGNNVLGGDFNMYVGEAAGKYNQTGNGNIGIGWRSAGGEAGSVGSADWNVCIGESTGRLLKAGDSNVMIGQGAGFDCVTGDDNVLIGRIAGFNVTASSNVMIGYLSGFTATTTDRCIYLGNYSGSRQTTLDDILIIDNRQQASVAAEVTNVIVYGVMNATPANQSLRFNVGTTTWHNATHEDSDGGRANQLNFKGQQSGGEETTLARIEVSHDGAVDDQKGKIVLSTNDGSDADTPTIAMTIDSAQRIGVGIAPEQKLTIYDAVADPILNIVASGDIFPRLQLERRNGSTKTNVIWELSASTPGGLDIRNNTAGTSVFQIQANSPEGTFKSDSTGILLLGANPGLLFGFGTTAPIYSGVQFVTNAGAFMCSDSNTDNANKIGRWGVPHYDTDEQPFICVHPTSSSGVNSLKLGGGTSLGNAATTIEFYTAAGATTVTGTLRAAIDSAGVFKFQNDGGLPFAQIYDEDGTSTLALAAQDTFYQITAFSVDGESNDAVPDHTNDHITITTPGKYLVSASIGFSQTTAVSIEYDFHVQKNNGATDFPGTSMHRNSGGSNAVGNAAVTGILDLAANDTVELWVERLDGAAVSRTITIRQVSLSLVHIGGT